MERVLESNAATLALTGTLLGRFVSRKWWYLPGVVSVFLLQHALQGWCPPVEVFRRMGVRTRREIDVEKFALKVLRGDFDAVLAEGPVGAGAEGVAGSTSGNATCFARPVRLAKALPAGYRALKYNAARLEPSVLAGQAFFGKARTNDSAAR